MRSANSWIDVIHPAAHFGSEGELEREIKRVQSDAMQECANIINTLSRGTKSEDRSIAIDEARDAILERMKELK